MFGFNVGVSMTYLDTVRLLQQGATVYASSTDRYIDIIPSEIEEDRPMVEVVMEQLPESEARFTDSAVLLPVDDAETEAVLQVADDYLAKAEALKSQTNAVPITQTPAYDFASMFGLKPTSAKEDTSAEVKALELPRETLQKVTEEEPLEEPVEESVEESHPTTQSVVQQVVATESVVQQPVMQQSVANQSPVIQSTAPDLSGMTLKGQAQAIGKWTTTPIMSEAVLFDAFGKSVVLKLVSEGYLVRTKKGIMLGS